MSMLRKPIETATFVAVLLHASTSFAHAAPRGSRTPVGTTTTTAAPYAPPGGERFVERTIERSPHRPLLGTGGGLFLLSYAPSAVVGAMSDRSEDRQLLIPVVGPWMDLEQRKCGAETPCGPNEDIHRAMIVTSGVVQGAGVLTALGALIIPETTTIEERERTALRPWVRVLPVSLGSGAGIGAVGRF